MNWLKAKQEYIMSADIGYRTLAEKYGVTFKQVRYRADKENWRELRAAHMAEIEAQNAKELAAHPVTESGRIAPDCAEKVRNAALKSLDYIVLLLEKPDELMLAARDIKSITAAIKDIKEILMLKGEADIREQEARIKALEKQTEVQTDTALEVVGIPEEYRR